MGIKKVFCRHTNYPLVFVRNITGDETNMAGGKRSVWRCPECGKVILRPQPYYPGEISDGYHTFNELYHHRAVLFSVICNDYKDIAWKSKQHDDPNEPMYDGMFIVGIETPEGQATYHYDIDPYWDMFDVRELERAPKWDGHTPDEAIRRIGNLVDLKDLNNENHMIHAYWEYDSHPDDNGNIRAYCSHCHARDEHSVSMVGNVPFCWKCGAKMNNNKLKQDDDRFLVCYEEPADFCRRHALSKWLRDDGFECCECAKDEKRTTE